MLGSLLLFISVTSRLNLFFRNDVLPDTILFTGLVSFMHTDVMLSISFRPMLLIKI